MRMDGSRASALITEPRVRFPTVVHLNAHPAKTSRMSHPEGNKCARCIKNLSLGPTSAAAINTF